jgi:inorganic triphosphatase YgiF
MKRAAAPFLKAAKSEKLRLHDVYLDDEKHTLRAEKIALRLRGCNGNWEATLKTRTEVKNGKAVRKEFTFPVGKSKNFAQALISFQTRKTWKNIPLKNLRAQFEIFNTRQIYMLNFEGAQAELALDDCEIRVAGRRVKMKEIELELKKGAGEKLESLARHFSHAAQLRFQKMSKVFTAETLLALWGEK